MFLQEDKDNCINTTIVNRPDYIHEDKWYQFVIQHSHGNVFYTPYFFRVASQTDNLTPFIYAAIRANKIVGILAGHYQKQADGFLGQLTSRSLIWGVPLADNNDPEIISALLDEYLVKAGKRAVYTEIRNQSDPAEANEVLSEKGFIYGDHLNIIVDLQLSEEELWKGVHSKRRNEIRRAVKEGVTFAQGTGREDLDNCYEILREVYSRAKLPLPEREFFHHLFEESDETSNLIPFMALYEGKTIGCMLCLAFNGVLFDFYAGSFREFYKKYPNDLIPWEVFKWGKQNGYKMFNFGGAGKPNIPYGVRDYKKKFGGSLVNYGRYQMIHRPLIYRSAEFALKIWRNFR